MSRLDWRGPSDPLQGAPPTLPLTNRLPSFNDDVVPVLSCSLASRVSQDAEVPPAASGGSFCLPSQKATWHQKVVVVLILPSVFVGGRIKGIADDNQVKTMEIFSAATDGR